MSEGSGVEIETTFAKVKAHGEQNANLILLAITIGFVAFVGWQMTGEHRDIANNMAKINSNLNDVFIAVMTSPETKENLSPYLKEKLDEKVKEKTYRKLQQSE